MFVHGTKLTKRKVGWVADFCPIFRIPQSFKLTRIGLVSHIYFLSIGSGKLIRHEIECSVCGLLLISDPLRDENPERQRPDDVSVLAEKTFPGLAKAYAERLQEEYALRTNPQALGVDRRNELLLDPFALLDPLVEERSNGSSGTQLDRQSGLGCLATLLVPVGMVAVSLIFKIDPGGSGGNKVLAVGAALFVVGVLYTFIQLALGTRRYVRKQIIPMLARALAPLSPTREELQHCINRCKSIGMSIGKAVRVEHLLTALGNVRRL